LWQFGRAVVLLAGDSLPHSLPATLAARVACLLRAVSLPHEHDESAAAGDYLSRGGDSSLLQTEILAPVTAGTRLHLDVRPVCAVDSRGALLGRDNRLGGTPF